MLLVDKWDDRRVRGKVCVRALDQNQYFGFYGFLHTLSLVVNNIIVESFIVTERLIPDKGEIPGLSSVMCMLYFYLKTRVGVGMV